ncbi:MAG: chromosome segregation protein SMC [Armatimonadota bacterium]|nr:chromosome segregation protein SMC [Armatimonadota bacterium]
MYLKRLELLGFKTFAEKTEIDLTPGVTAVVGPNGSGKSNIADAILWALGEQNVRSLRGTKIQDVIFAGSDTRKPLGMAEVSMTIDNSSGQLPLEFSEVTITRRAFRSGDGEYFINKTPCRLKDIYELFMDTGVGREAYSIINQGEIDAVLSARSEDRRALFEEAAGVKKYRHRRKEATRKLENTQQNLQRVNDIVSELGSQIDPLREQAEVAKRYHELSTRLREIEVGLLISDLRRRSAELETVLGAKGDGDSQILQHDSRISELEEEQERLHASLIEQERQLDQSRAGYQELSSERQRLESLAALMEERARAADELCKNLDLEIAVLETRREETRERMSRLDIDATSARDREAGLAAEIAGLVEESEALDGEAEEASKKVDDQKANYIELAKEEAARLTDAENSKERVTELKSSLAKLSSELDVLLRDKQNASERAEAAVKLSEALKDDLAKIDAALETARAARAENEENLDEDTQRQAELNKLLLEKASRLRALKEMADSHEGFYQGVRSVMAAAKAHKVSGHFAVVADIITVPEGFETAIEVALGSSVQDIVADTQEEAKRAIQFLKTNDSGRVTFLPLNGIRPTVSNMMGDARKFIGFQGMAADLLQFDKKYNPAVNLLLGKVVVMDNIDNAIKLCRSAAGWNKIVTLDGEVILPTGAMTGGSRVSKGQNLIARKQEMDSLTAQVVSLQKEFDSREKALNDLREKTAKFISEIQSLDQSASQKRISLADSERAAEYLTQECKRLGRESEVVAEEKDAAAAQLAEEEAALQRLLAELQSAGQENVDLDEVVAQAQKILDSIQTRRKELRDELLKLNVELAGAKERRSNQSQSSKDAAAALEEIAAAIASKQEQRKKTEIDSFSNSKERQAALTRLGEQTTVYEAATEALSELLAKKNELSERVSAVDHDLRNVSRARNELAQLIHDADVKEARLEVQLTQIKDRLLEEYEISEETAQGWPEEIDVERGTATEVGRLRREIRDMGAVNIGAVQEYDRLSERWDFLSTQKADLEAARNSLTNAINEIDDSTRDMFMDTFYAVAEAFEMTFRRLFDGGATKLLLTNPEDLLETGIEIIVQPPGKTLQNLTLLSGGEKALTAAALLFALMKVKPSPFCVMDEVDAPLDESNVERFADLLKEFSENTQFIVITHNRATMEASDTLYGVTMEEPGISKLISVMMGSKEAAGGNGEIEALATEAVTAG